MNAPSLKIWNGKDLAQNLEAVAALRIRVFHDFPYLYEGSLAYEKQYLEVYIKSSRSVLVAALDGDKLIGLSSALPLRDEADYVQEPFLQAGMNIDELFYFGESILLPEYRGFGLGHKFFDEREKAARSHAQYTKTFFFAVQRAADHPSRPVNYRPLNEFWQKRGYQIQPEIKAYFSWTDLGDTEETTKPMTCWLKNWK